MLQATLCPITVSLYLSTMGILSYFQFHYTCLLWGFYHTFGFTIPVYYGDSIILPVTLFWSTMGILSYFRFHYLSTMGILSYFRFHCTCLLWGFYHSSGLTTTLVYYGDSSILTVSLIFSIIYLIIAHAILFVC